MEQGCTSWVSRTQIGTKYKAIHGGVANFKEKIMAALYLKLLVRPCKPYYRYTVHLCRESWMKSDVAATKLLDISQANKYEPDVAPTLQKYCNLLCLPDYVASATRKNNLAKLTEIENFIHANSSIPKRYLKKLFVYD
jgi:hypothetical protein